MTVEPTLQAFLTSVVPTMALFSPVVSIAILLSTVGAGIQSLVGAPKLLQVIASDRIIPPLNWFNGASPGALHFSSAKLLMHGTHFSKCLLIVTASCVP